MIANLIALIGDAVETFLCAVVDRLIAAWLEADGVGTAVRDPRGGYPSSPDPLSTLPKAPRSAEK